MSTAELTALIDLLTKYARISRQGGFTEQAEDALSLRDDRVRAMVVGR